MTAIMNGTTQERFEETYRELCMNTILVNSVGLYGCGVMGINSDSTHSDFVYWADDKPLFIDNGKEYIAKMIQLSCYDKKGYQAAEEFEKAGFKTIVEDCGMKIKVIVS